jgi:hypothetical protein
LPWNRSRRPRASGPTGEIRNRFPSHDRVEHVRIEVSAVRPNDRAKGRINRYGAEHFRITERREHAFEWNQARDIDLALDAVVEPEPD